MLFARRHAEPIATRICVGLWPRVSWRRSWGYSLLRLARLKASDTMIATGFAAGVFAACLPFLGLQIIIAIALAFALRGDTIAAVAGTFIANPLTMPLLYGGSFHLGCWMLGTEAVLQAQLNKEMGLGADIAALWEPVLKPMIAGAIPIGIICAAGSFDIVRSAMGRLRAQRKSSAVRSKMTGALIT
jgi:uncharacterized protein